MDRGGVRCYGGADQPQAVEGGAPVSEGRILVVDDDDALRELLVEDLSERGFTVVPARSAEDALARLESTPIDVVVTDLRMPGQGGMRLCRQLHAHDPSRPVILMTAFGSMDLAIEALRSGAYDFLVKPFELEQLAMAVERATTLSALRAEIATLRARVRSASEGGRLHGTSPVMVRLRESVAQIAATQATVLVRGERGVGRELVCRELHDLGPRAAGPFVSADLAALAPAQLPAVLLGQAPTPTVPGGRPGLLQRAHRGTLFLSGIDALPADLQAQLLHVLEERRVRPLGAAHELPVDVRCVVATHRDLDVAVQQGLFRRDLLFRLSVFEVDVPPLR